MKTRFRVLIQRSDEDNHLEKMYVPSLNYELDFLKHADEVQLFNALGQQYYLELKLASVVKTKRAAQEKIEDSSTMALMTQGFSELTGSTHSYEIYFVNKFKDIKPSHIDGIGIMIVGQGPERQAYLVSNNVFYSVKNKRWRHDFSLSPEQLTILQDTDYESNGSPEISLENCLLLNCLKKDISNAAGWIYLGTNSYPLDIYLSDHDRRPCHIFTTVMPPLTRFSMLMRISISTLMNLGLVDSMDNPFFPPATQVFTNSTTGNSTSINIANPYLRPFNITQTLLGFMMMFVFVFVGTRSRTLAGLGLQIDDAVIKFYRKLCGNEKVVPKTKKPSKKCTWLDTKMTIAKTLFMLLILNQMFLSSLWSYLRISTLSNSIAGTDNSMFSVEFIKDISIIEWALEQLNEPSLILAESAFVIYIVENYFKPTNMLQSISEQAAEKDKMIAEVKEEKPSPIEMSSLEKPLLEEEKKEDVRHHAIDVAGEASMLFSTRNPKNVRAPVTVSACVSGVKVDAEMGGEDESKSRCLVM